MRLNVRARIYVAWVQGIGFPQLPSAVISTVAHPLGLPSLYVAVYNHTGDAAAMMQVVVYY
jgi:hypothetical protein